MMNRLFISANIPELTKQQIIEIRDEIYGYDKSIRWEAKDKLHFTLKFLGDVEQNKNYTIISELEKITNNFKSINCSFTEFGIFNKGNIPSILWLGINHNEELIKLAETIEHKFIKHGFPKETRNFKPHLTLLRLKGKEDINRINNFLKYKLSEINFNIYEISLMKSELLRSGSVYNQIKSFKLN